MKGHERFKEWLTGINRTENAIADMTDIPVDKIMALLDGKILLRDIPRGRSELLGIGVPKDIVSALVMDGVHQDLAAGQATEEKKTTWDYMRLSALALAVALEKISASRACEILGISMSDWQTQTQTIVRMARAIDESDRNKKGEVAP